MDLKPKIERVDDAGDEGLAPLAASRHLPDGELIEASFEITEDGRPPYVRQIRDEA